ncbi:hypothetical protein GE061_009519 [Apolygus lucorum]|uniref:Ig-like domain-containing protein n=1 Tax=Apolygus lucorum TaxID=248454 RepID=A0A8S9Y346_APOLU|nr:hypothetical protein GE061_009519 [Apolygus lucorum]
MTSGDTDSGSRSDAGEEFMGRLRIHEGSTLRLPRISRSDMGHYMCMASNGVPPAVSKRISINVHFPPVIQVPNQLVGAPLGTDVNLECYVEASPKAIIYWMRDSNPNPISGTDKLI